MTNMELMQLFGETKDTYVQEAQRLRGGEKVDGGSGGRKPFSTRKVWVLAAAVVTLLALSATACAAISARIRVRLVDNHVDPDETVAAHAEGQKPLTVGEILTTCYPQSLPDGYSCVTGMSEGSVLRNLYYENEDGKEIVFAISTTRDFSGIPLNAPVEEKTVQIAGQNATLTISGAGTQNLVWENTEIGFHANLMTEDPQVDLAAMAESVAPGDPLPLSFHYVDGKLWEAWYPQKLPEGYECNYVSQVNSGGSQQIRYVNRDDGCIEFFIATEKDLSDIGEAPFSLMVWENVDIGGIPGRKVSIGDHQWMLFWKNEAEGFNAGLSTDSRNVDLVEIAKSVGPGKKLEPTRSQGPGYTLELEQDRVYVGYEPWYPRWIPEGYAETFVSDKAYGEQSIRFENADGDLILYTFYFRMGQWGRAFESMAEPEQVDINGHIGYKTVHSVIWTDEERGFGFALEASPNVDILKMARSVATGPEPAATYADKTQVALKQLGDYQIRALPEGMFEDGLTGMPLENGSGWYAYVRRWYFSKESGAEIYFEYETYVTDDLGSPEEMCRMRLSGSEHTVTDVEICGCVGGYQQDGDTAHVTWATGDGTKGTVFYMTSREFTAEELVKIAQSVEEMN